MVWTVIVLVDLDIDSGGGKGNFVVLKRKEAVELRTSTY